MVIDNRYTFRVPCGSTVEFTYWYDQKVTTIDASKDMFCHGLAIAKGINPTELVQSEWRVWLSHYFDVWVMMIHVCLVISTCNEYWSEIQVPSDKPSDLSDCGGDGESGEDEITMYFFHSAPNQDRSGGNIGVWSLSATLDDEGQRREIPLGDVDIREGEYVLGYGFGISVH